MAVVGAGGIGFDVAEFLVHPPPTDRPGAGRAGWPSGAWPIRREARGGVVEAGAAGRRPGRSACCSARPSRPGAGLGKTTGWIHRAALKAKRVEMLAGVNYEGIDDRGLTIRLGDGRARLPARWTTWCSAPARSRGASSWRRSGRPASTVHVIGGADVAAELDAKRAIEQGTRLGATL